MSTQELKLRRQKRKLALERCRGCKLTRFSDGELHIHKEAKPKNNSQGVCKRCGKTKRIHSKGMCATCYDKDSQKGFCEECNENAVLRDGKCDSCYKNENYSGRCELCKKSDKALKKGLCSTCYKKQHFIGICRECHKEDTLTKGLCNACWDNAHRDGSCSSCGHEGQLKAGLCSTCYKKKNLSGECKTCQKEGVLTDGLCKTCYDKEHYSGLCDSCGDFGVLISGYCRTCHNKKDAMGECKKCNNLAILDHHGVCEKCSRTKHDVGICRVCAKERPLVFANMCLECYQDKANGIQHYMRSSIRKIIERLVGKDNINKDPEEIFLKGAEEPFKADFEIRDLTGKWCPTQYFQSRQEWSSNYKSVENFKAFYEKYLQPKNYIMFTTDHAKPEAIKQYLIDRGFLQPTGLPYGKNITRKQGPLSKR